MPLTVKQLRTPVTQDQALTTILNELQSLGFNSSSWQSGSVQRTMLTGVALVFSTVTEFVAFITDFSFNETATSEALTEFSDSHYDNQRVTDVATLGLVVLTGGAVGPPHTIAIGDAVVRDPVSGQTFRNTTAATVPVSGVAAPAMTFRAESPGTAGNVANDTITELVTTLTGVTSNNPDPGSGTWITTQGVDQETDPTLRTRNTTKWSTLNIVTKPADGYINIALTADSDITKVTVDSTNPRGPGTVDVYIARGTGVAVAADVTTVQTAVDLRRPVSADVLVIAAAAQAISIVGTIHLTTSLDDAAGVQRAAIEQAAIDYVNGLDIGGEVLPGSTDGFLIHSELIQAISDIAGVRRVLLTSPTVDVLISGFSVATTGTPTFTYINID